MRRGAGTAAAALVLFAAGCAPSLMKLPAGAGTPASDAADAFIDATAACNAVSSISAEIAVAGAVGGRRLHARLLAGLASPASARLEAVAPAGQPLFILVASGDDATLLFPREQRVLPHGRPAAVLEAVAGIPLDPIDLRATLTGCSLAAPENGRAFRRKPPLQWSPAMAETLNKLAITRRPRFADRAVVASRPLSGSDAVSPTLPERGFLSMGEEGGVDRSAFLEAMRKAVATVGIVSTDGPGGRFGLTVS